MGWTLPSASCVSALVHSSLTGGKVAGASTASGLLPVELVGCALVVAVGGVLAAAEAVAVAGEAACVLDVFDEHAVARPATRRAPAPVRTILDSGRRNALESQLLWIGTSKP